MSRDCFMPTFWPRNRNKEKIEPLLPGVIAK